MRRKLESLGTNHSPASCTAALGLKAMFLQVFSARILPMELPPRPSDLPDSAGARQERLLLLMPRLIQH